MPEIFTFSVILGDYIQRWAKLLQKVTPMKR